MRKELPDTTIIYLEEEFRHSENFDVFVELQHGNIKQAFDNIPKVDAQQDSSADLARMLQVLEQTEFFEGLDRKQMRLLAFSAHWFAKQAGELIFQENDDPIDGVFLILQGEAELYSQDGS